MTATLSSLGGPAPQEESVATSPGWLSAALGHRFPGAEITGVEVVERLQTVATKTRFRVTYAQDVGAPDALCIKGYFDPEMRTRGTTGQAEVRFYAELAPSTGVLTPDCVYGGIDPDTGHGLILMNDLVAEGCTFRTALSPYTVDQAAATLDQLARLNAYDWGGTRSAHLDFLGSRVDAITRYVTPETLQSHLDGPRTDGLPGALTRADRVQQALFAALAADAGRPPCVVHADAHAGNTYAMPDGRAGLIDWQVVQLGGWALDVAYHVSTVLEPTERERSERSLLEHYLSRLTAYGVTPPTWDEAWLQYRTHLAYGYWMWAITRMVDPPVIREFMQRIGTAMAFHDTFGLLGV